MFNEWHMPAQVEFLSRYNRLELSQILPNDLSGKTIAISARNISSALCQQQLSPLLTSLLASRLQSPHPATCHFVQVENYYYF